MVGEKKDAETKKQKKQDKDQSTSSTITSEGPAAVTGNLATVVQQLLQLSAENANTISQLTKIVQTSSGSRAPVKFNTFNEAEETIAAYTDRLDLYFRVQKIPEEEKVDTFISLLPPRLYEQLKNTLYPETYSSYTYTVLTGILQNIINPKPLVMLARFKLHNRKQLQSETCEQFLQELRKLAVNCNYAKEELDLILLNSFVFGLQNRIILDRVLELKDLTLDTAKQTASTMESALAGAGDVLNVKPAIPSGSAVKKVTDDSERKKAANAKKKNKQKQAKPNPKSQTPATRHSRNSSKEGESPNEPICFKCSKKGHKSNACDVRATCSYCNRSGHIERFCRVKKRDNGSTSSTYTLDVWPVNRIHFIDEEDVQPVFTTLHINGKPVTFEVDCGSAKSIINYATYQLLSHDSRLNLVKTKHGLRNYDQSVIKPAGVLRDLRVQYGNRVESLSVLVVNEKLENILGRNWMQKFGISVQFRNGNSSPGSSSDIHSLSESCAKAKLQALIRKYNTVMDDSMGEVVGCEVKLCLKANVKPKFRNARTVPFSLRERLDRELDVLENDGILTKVLHSEWATPIVPVVKPSGRIRICADYSCTLNSDLEDVIHPLPKTEELFAKFNGGRRFSKLDIRSAYLHMKVDAASSLLQTINTHRGLYKCNRLMFGIKTAPALWQRYIENLFKDVPGVGVFYDDIVVTGPDDVTHLERIEEVLRRLSQANIRVNVEKSEFFTTEVAYLGFKFSVNGMEPTDDKIRALLEIPPPKSVTELKAFLGVVTFYGRFVPNLSTVAFPLNNLTRNNVKFHWSAQCEKAFRSIKQILASAETLVHYSPDLPLILAVDASSVGVGAVLSHLIDGVEKPIAYASKTLSQTQQRYSQIDKEAYAIRWGVEKFFYYLCGRRFTLYTDHQPLVHIFKPSREISTVTATRLFRYGAYLQSFQFDIKYRQTKQHGNADCLSRFPSKSENLDFSDETSDSYFAEVRIIRSVNLKQIEKETLVDESMRQLYEELLLGKRNTGYSLENGCIFYGHRICIPASFREKVLNELHTGHIGGVKMKMLARAHVFWPNINKDIETRVERCTECQLHANNPGKATNHPWQQPRFPWDRIHIDYAGPFYGHTFLVVVDSYSKWLEVFRTSSMTCSATIELLDSLFARYGYPITLVSDNGTNFTSQDFKEFLDRCGIVHILTAPYHPSSNGQAERFVQTFKQNLRKVLPNSPTRSQVDAELNKFLLSYRRAPHVGTGESPARLFLNRNIRSGIDLLKASTSKKNQQLSTTREFAAGNTVMFRNYTATAKWLIGKVASRDGSVNYTVEANNQFYRRHIDQLKPINKAADFVPQPEVKPIQSHSSDTGPEDTAPPTTVPEKPETRRSARNCGPPDRLTL